MMEFGANAVGVPVDQKTAAFELCREQVLGRAVRHLARTRRQPCRIELEIDDMFMIGNYDKSI